MLFAASMDQRQTSVDDAIRPTPAVDSVDSMEHHMQNKRGKK